LQDLILETQEAHEKLLDELFKLSRQANEDN
jgi:hypothetical protein